MELGRLVDGLMMKTVNVGLCKDAVDESERLQECCVGRVETGAFCGHPKNPKAIFFISLIQKHLTEIRMAKFLIFIDQLTLCRIQ